MPVPILTTTIISGITMTDANGGGRITSDAGSAITVRGICWSKYHNPTISNNKTSDGNDTGSFTSKLTNLTANSTYYVRAYATNSNGTGYGNEVSFKTCIVQDIDGNYYQAVTIGTQVWFVENLKTTKFRTGASISNVSDNTQWSNMQSAAYCNYENSINNGNIYGRLYNWYAVNDSRKICPTGWHVPSDTEWETLVTFLGGYNVAGGKLKETGIIHWNSPNLGATNETGFTALGGGKRCDPLGYTGVFVQIKVVGYFWSSTIFNANLSWTRIINAGNSEIKQDSDKPTFGLSVRCMKD